MVFTTAKPPKLPKRLFDLDDLRRATPKDKKGRYVVCLVCGEPMVHDGPDGRPLLIRARVVCPDDICISAYFRYWRRAQKNRKNDKRAKAQKSSQPHR
jgi:hypothetical protein